MDYAWILIGLFVLIGLLTRIDSDSPFTPLPGDENEEDENDENDSLHDAWDPDDIYTDPAFSWLPGNIYYTGDDDHWSDS